MGLAGSFFQINCDFVVFDVSESFQGDTDLNGDGDTDDRVLHVYDASTGSITKLGLVGSFFQINCDFVVFNVSESFQGDTDLNGDGDTNDDVLHVLGISDLESSNLSIVKSGSPDLIPNGNQFTYTVTINNGGKSDATNVVVTDILPAGITFVSATISQGLCSESGGIVTCTLGIITSGSSVTATTIVTVDSNTTGVLTSIASVTSDTADLDTSDNIAIETIGILSTSGISDTQITTDPDENIIITGSDSSGNMVVEVILPRGTSIDGKVEVIFETTGQNSAAEIIGVTVPYPPGKSITIQSNLGSQNVCIGDTTQTVFEGGLPNCGSTDTSISQVIMSCNSSGVTQTFTGFPDTPTRRTYICTKFTDAGKTFMTIEGLAFSFVLDGGDIDGILDDADNCHFISNENQRDIDVDGVGDVCDSNFTPPPVIIVIIMVLVSSTIIVIIQIRRRRT